MGFRESASSLFNQSMDKASKTGRMAQVSIEQTRLKQQRSQLVETLGDAVYPTLKAHPDLIPDVRDTVQQIADID